MHINKNQEAQLTKVTRFLFGTFSKKKTRCGDKDKEVSKVCSKSSKLLEELSRIRIKAICDKLLLNDAKEIYIFLKDMD